MTEDLIIALLSEWKTTSISELFERVKTDVLVEKPNFRDHALVIHIPPRTPSELISEGIRESLVSCSTGRHTTSRKAAILKLG